MSTLKLLIDRNLIVHAQTTEYATGKQKVEWAGGTAEMPILGFRGKKPRGKWLRQQISALPTIARLSHEGSLLFHTTREIQFEGMFGPIGSSGPTGNLFRDLKFEHVQAAVERSFFSSASITEHARGDALAAWLKDFLLRIDEDSFLKTLSEYRELPQFCRENISNLHRFREICKYATSDDQIRDAFHMWTAEVNGLDYFLTADRRFINAMTRSSPLDLPAPPIAPDDLLKRLSIDTRDPLPIGDDRFRFMWEVED